MYENKYFYLFIEHMKIHIVNIIVWSMLYQTYKIINKFKKKQINEAGKRIGVYNIYMNNTRAKTNGRKYEKTWEKYLD